MCAELYSLFLVPLFSAVFIVLFLRKQKWTGATVSVASAFFCLVMLLYIMLGSQNSSIFESSFSLFELGKFSINMGVLFDSATMNMLFVVCFVGFLIHIFSVGYMDDDHSKSRFFAGLSFFMFSMTGLVLSSNLFMMFIFWELVGFSSYALIAHYADTEAAKAASKKAFIVNRVGDIGFLLGIILCYYTFGTTSFTELAQLIKANPSHTSTLMGLLLMCGFLGKSAQFPFQVWLSDAMAGPTPVSALIHAATMVAAGVFMLVRLSAIGMLTPEVLDVITLLCSSMALLAGLWALGQNDIKKILAYSTLAHLGLMGAGVGLGYDLAMFHLTTHAFFKATLFLVAGSVIHACHHEQDIYKMGGLFNKMPITSLVATFATLSIIAVPYFAGYYSKEGILLASYAKAQVGGVYFDKIIFWIIMGAALLTPVYMGRLFFNVFMGTPHSQKAQNAKESSLFMTLPLVVLAIFSFAGAWGFVYDITWLGGKMSGIMPASACEFVGNILKTHNKAIHSVNGIGTLELVALVSTVLGVLFAYFFYGRNRGYDTLERKCPLLYNALYQHGWFDTFYDWYVAKVQQRFAVLLDTFVDLFIIELLCVRGLGVVCAVIGYGLKGLHACTANSQIRWFAVGLVFVFAFIFIF